MNVKNINPDDIRSRQELIERLIDTPMSVKKGQSLVEAKGWKEVVEDVSGDERKMFLACMLENCKKQIIRERQGGVLSEDTQAIAVGNWEKFGFPLISMVAENLITPELVTVQPLQGPSGQVFFMDYTVGQTKGNIVQGAKLWDSRAAHGPSRDYAGERIDVEPMFVTVSGTSPVTGNLGYTPVRPGTVIISNGNDTYTDDSNGNLIASGFLTAGTINYNSGAYSLTFSGSQTVGSQVTITYYYNSEGSTNLPQVDFDITSQTIFAQAFKLRGRWSFEAEQMLQALHGLKAEAQLSAAISSEIQFEIDRFVLAQLWNTATAGYNQWNATVPTGISFTEHKLSFVDAIHELSMFILRATARVRANWVLVGVQGAAILLNHPLFEPSPLKAEQDGVTFLGTLNKLYKVYVDPHTDPTAYLVGYKGDNFMRTGYIFAPWLLLYQTETIALDDFTKRKGFASQFGTKSVNTKYYAKGNITNYPTVF